MANIRVPYLDLKAQYRSIKPEIDQAVAGVLDSCQFVLGPEVADFEREFAAYCGTTDCIALNSGTSALHLALLAAAFWSAYTIAFRYSGLTAVECSALVAAWSAAFALPFGAPWSAQASRCGVAVVASMVAAWSRSK